MMSRSTPPARHTPRTRQAVFLDLDSFVNDDGRLPEDFDVLGLVGDLRDRGYLSIARAYADWGEFPELGQALGRAGFELVQVFPVRGAGGSSIPVCIAADAVCLLSQENQVESVILVAEQVDFSGLARRLRERDYRVIGVGLSGELACLSTAFDVFHSNGRLRDRFTRSHPLRRDESSSPFNAMRFDTGRRKAVEWLMNILARLRQAGHSSVTESQLLAELKNDPSGMDLGALGFSDIASLVRALGRRVHFERVEGELVISTSTFSEEDENGSLTTPEDYENLLARLQLRITPSVLRETVVSRVFEVIQASIDGGRPMTAQEVEDILSEEFLSDDKEDHRDALRDTLRVLFVNRAFRLENVDDGYHSPLTFNRLYIRTNDDLQSYYVEAILCAIKNRIRERGGGSPDMKILAQLIIGSEESHEKLAEIDGQLQGADRPFKKPPRYSNRWTPQISSGGGSGGENSADAAAH